MKMNKYISLVFCLLLCSCASGPNFINPISVKDHVTNGCAVDAVNFQSELNSKDIKWSKILNIYFYSKSGSSEGHTTCVFQYKDGTIWSWDIRGYVKIDGDGSDPMDVSRQIPGMMNVHFAYYEESLEQ